MSPVQQRVLERLERGPATLAQLRDAFDPGEPESRALMSMGEEDPFGQQVTALVQEGRVLDDEGRYRLPSS